MKRLIGFFHWLYFVILFLPITMLTALLAILNAPLTRNSYFLRGYARLWGKIGVRLSLNSCLVIGENNLPKEGCVIISNHQSMVDIFAALGYYPLDFLFLSKIEVARIPLVGFAMKRIGYLFVDRHSPKKAAQSIQKVVEKIREGNNVLIYPEGTRSNNAREFLPFKSGTIKAAKEGNLTLLPIVLYGTQEVKPVTIPRYFTRHPIVISVMKPITPGSAMHPGSGDDDKERLEKIRLSMQQEYNRLLTQYAPK